MATADTNKHKLTSFLLAKCPRCGKGKVFPHSPFNPAKFSVTHENCQHCGLQFQPETGFFFGAMYWSYAMIVGMIVTLAVTFNMLDLFEYAIWVIPCAIIILLPFIFRYSRLLMLYVVYPVMYREKYEAGSTSGDAQSSQK